MSMLVAALLVLGATVERNGTIEQQFNWLQGRWEHRSYPATGESRTLEVWAPEHPFALVATSTTTSYFGTSQRRMRIHSGAGGAVFLDLIDPERPGERYRLVQLEEGRAVFDNPLLVPQSIHYIREGDRLTIAYGSIGEENPRHRVTFDRR